VIILKVMIGEPILCPFGSITQWSVIKTTATLMKPAQNKGNKDVVFSKLSTCE
jgi:hypothetical protein